MYMETIKYQKMDVDKIIDGLLKGGIFAFPTDTVFGLGCSIYKEAIDNIYLAKGRSFNKPLPMMCNSLEMLERYAYVPEYAKSIIDKYMPGPLTIVFKAKESVDSFITNNKDTIAIRIPDDKWILNLITKLNQPLLVTSANISNTGSLIKWQDVYKQLNTKIDGIICEDATGEYSSTIIDVTGDIKLIREGPIPFDLIKECV